MRLRAPSLEDAEAAFAVIDARETVDLGYADYTFGDLCDAWQRSDVDLAADVRLVEDAGGHAVGYGMIDTQGALGLVAPEAEGRGAGTLLLEWLMERERQRAHAKHRQWVLSTNPTAPALLGGHGFQLARSDHRMVRRLDAPIDAARTEGVTLRPPRIEDIEAMHALDERAFANDPGYVAESLTHFEEEHLEAHDSAPDLSRVALAGDRVVGFLLARRRKGGTVGYVDVLAVDPEYHRRGIGRALLLDAFSAFAADGLREAQLNVSSVNPGALALYRRAGMTDGFTADIWERPI